MLKYDRTVIKSRIFWAWFGSYLVVLLIPLMIAGMVFGSLINNTSENIYDVRKTALWQFGQLFDQRLGDIERVATSIPFIPEVNFLKKDKTATFNTNVYDSYLLQKELFSRRSQQSFIKSIYLYSARSASVLSTQGLDDLNALTLGFVPPEFIPIAEQTAHIQDKTEGFFYVSKSVGRFGDEQTHLIYCNPFRLSSSPEDIAAVFIVVDLYALRDILNNSLYDRSGDFLLVSGDCIIPLNRNMNIQLDFSSAEGEKQGTFTFKNNDNKYSTAMWIRSASHDWSYAHVFESDLVSSTVKHYLLLYGICLFFCFCGGIAVAYIFTRWNYHPVQTLEKLFSGDKKSSAARQKKIGAAEEFDNLITNVETLLTTSRSAQERLQQQEEKMLEQDEKLKEAILLRAFRGDGENRQESELIAYGFPLDEANFFVLLINMSHVNPENKWDGADIEEVLDKSARVYSMTNTVIPVNSQSCAVLLTIPNSVPISISEFREVVQNISDALKSHLPGIAVTCSALHSDLQELSVAYQEAELVGEYKHIMKQDAPVFYVGSVSLDMQVIHDIYDLEYNFLGYVRTRNYDMAESTLREIIDAEHELSVSAAKLRLGGIVNLLLAAAAELFTWTKGEQKDALRTISKELLTCQDFVTAVHLSEKMFALVRQAEASESKRSGQSIVEEAKLYIESNYSDMNLSVSAVADAVGVSSSYLTQLFRKNAHHSTADYIHMTRLREAKALIETHRIKDVAEQVGYQDVRSLIRVFKKYEGTTPGNFRSQGGLSDDE